MHEASWHSRDWRDSRAQIRRSPPAARCPARESRQSREWNCVDAETGQPYWTHETNGDIWSSPLVADGKVYIGTRRGDFWVFAAAREKQVLSMTDFGSPISATAVAANGVLYVATMTDLYAIEQASGISAARQPR